MDHQTPPLQLKVCGMKDPENIQDLLEQAPDFMGMIFFEKSPRHVSGTLDPEDIPATGSTARVGVFVNASTDYVYENIKRYSLAGVQLHGSEDPTYCKEMKKKGVLVIKAFSVGKEAFDFSQLNPYAEYVDYFLFDTKGKLPGGNGYTFNWEVLEEYKGPVPFFLSGGIHPDHGERIRNFSHPFLHGLDINSQFEIEPGFKDVAKVHEFWKALHIVEE